MLYELKSKLNDRWFWILFGLMAIAFCTSFYCVCNVTMLIGTQEQLSTLPDFFFFLSFGVGLLSFISLFVISIKKKAYTPSKGLLILFSILFVCNFFAVLFFPNGVTYSHFVLREGYKFDLVFSVENIRRVKSIIQFFMVLLVSFCILDLLPRVFELKTFFIVVSLFALVIVTGLIISTYFTDFEYSYKYIFTNPNAEDLKHHAVHSVFPNGNSFGIIIVLGIIASIFLNIFTKKWWWLLFPIYFLISMFFTFARLPLILGALIYIGYLLIQLILTWKNNPKRNLKITFVVAGVFVLLGVCLLVVELSTHIISQKLSSFFTYGGFNTFESRKAIWQNVIDILAVSNWRVGLGYQIFNDLLYEFNMAWEPILSQNINQTNSAHNGFLELLGNGGFVLLVSFLVLLGILIYKSIKIYKENKQIALFEYVLIAVALLYTMLESGIIIFSSNFDYMLLTLFITFPINYLYINQKKDLNISSI